MNLPVSRLWPLAALLLVGLSSIALLPDAPPIQPSRLGTDLPAKFGSWEGTKVLVSDRELSVLAEDTRFERRIYQKPFDVTRPPIEASFVYSGKDMNNSIHRPEVCLRTQGWNFVRERYVDIPGILPDGKPFPVREIICSKTAVDPETGKPIILPGGEIMNHWQIIYYTFIGATQITPSHYGRTLRDVRDRITEGYDQQWAYATFATQIPGNYLAQGNDIGAWDPLDNDQTGEYLADFMRELVPSLLSAPGSATPAAPIELSSNADQ